MGGGRGETEKEGECTRLRCRASTDTGPCGTLFKEAVCSFRLFTQKERKNVSANPSLIGQSVTPGVSNTPLLRPEFQKGWGCDWLVLE